MKRHNIDELRMHGGGDNGEATQEPAAGGTGTEQGETGDKVATE